MPTNKPSESNHEMSGLVVVGLLTLAIAITIFIGYVALDVMPCAWFGSPNEGGCGYAALIFVLKVGVVMAIVLAGFFIVGYSSFCDRKDQQQTRANGPVGGHEARTNHKRSNG